MGNFTATLTVTDAGGLTAQATRTISVVPTSNQTPHASFTVSPAIGIVPVEATLDGSASTDADGTITSYEWDFGDGTTGTGAIVTHTFDGAGPFVVSLKVTDNGGAENVFTQQLGYRTLAQVDVPVCGDQSDFNAVLRCADYALKPGVDIWHVQGDGPVDVTFDWVYQNSGRNNQLSAFVVDDDEGAIDGVQPGEPGYQQLALARARNVFPLGSSSFSPDVTLPFTGGDRIAFYISRASNSEIANTSDPTLMLFSIGAANWDRLPHSVAFDRPGGPSQFGFEDLEGGGDGDFDDVVFTASGITTEVSQPPVARFTRTPASGAPPLAVQFDAPTSSDEVGITSYAWSFGDGATDTGPTPQHTYTTAGTYTVTLTVTDTDGETAQASSTVVVVVGNQPPTVDAGPDVTLVESNRTLIVFPTASDPGGQIASYEWDYGDGSTSEGQVAVHSYATKGTFTATVTVTDDVGVTASDSLTVTIVNVDPVIGALDVPARALPDVALQMAAFVHDPGGLDTVAGSWDFGDGTPTVPVSGTTSIVSHVWDEPGTYTVTLRINDGDGGSDEQTAQVLVKAATIDAGPGVTGVEGQQVSFTRPFDGPQYSQAVVAWDFGDGTTAFAYSATNDQPIPHTYRDDGTYTVTATMQFNEGGLEPISDTTTRHHHQQPAVDQRHRRHGRPVVGETTSFQAFATDAGLDDVLSYRWDFGDGTSAHRSGGGAHVRCRRLLHRHRHASSTSGDSTSATRPSP